MTSGKVTSPNEVNTRSPHKTRATTTLRQVPGYFCPGPYSQLSGSPSECKIGSHISSLPTAQGNTPIYRHSTFLLLWNFTLILPLGTIFFHLSLSSRLTQGKNHKRDNPGFYSTWVHPAMKQFKLSAQRPGADARFPTLTLGCFIHPCK